MDVHSILGYRVRDTISDSLLWAPPSVVALGTFSSAQRQSELWFAPAGFTRGGLTEGSAGAPSDSSA